MIQILIIKQQPKINTFTHTGGPYTVHIYCTMYIYSAIIIPSCSIYLFLVFIENVYWWEHCFIWINTNYKNICRIVYFLVYSRCINGYKVGVLTKFIVQYIVKPFAEKIQSSLIIMWMKTWNRVLQPNAIIL